MNNTTLPSDNPLRIPVKEKSQTCEDGGAHIIISFWHLLINFEKPEKPEFWKNEKKQNKNKIKLKKKKKKKCWRYHHFTLAYQKPQSQEVHFLR